MLICGLKLTHDGSVAIVENGRLLCCIEMEKRNNNPRHSGIEDASVIADVLASEGIGLDDIDTFVIDGWGGFNADALAIQPRLEITAEHNTLAVNDGAFEYRLPVAQYCEQQVGGDILAGRQFDGLRIRGRSFPYRSYLHVAGHVLGAYCSSPFAAAGESSYVLVWDGGMFPHLYHVNPAAGCVESLGPVFLLIGNIYTIFSQHFGPFKAPGTFAKDDLSIAGKVMAYIALGGVNREWFEDFQEVYQQRYDAPMGFANVFARAFKERLGTSKFRDEDVLCSFHHFLKDLLVSKLAKKIERTGRLSGNLCIAGGCALNIKWNQAIRAAGIVDAVFVPPFPNDSGSGLGMACTLMFAATADRWLDWSVYSGPKVEDSDPLAGWTVRRCSPADCGRLLHEAGEPLVFLSGRAELGPRALGNRSILAPAVNGRMKDLLNRVKRRESYRPVSPICLEDRAADIFCPGSPDPFMLFDHRVSEQWKASVPAICHLDGTARLQTISRDEPAEIVDVLSGYSAASGIPLLCNTSANSKGCGFFPDARSAMAWDGSNYVWCEGHLFERQNKVAFPELH